MVVDETSSEQTLVGVMFGTRVESVSRMDKGQRKCFNRGYHEARFGPSGFGDCVTCDIPMGKNDHFPYRRASVGY